MTEFELINTYFRWSSPSDTITLSIGDDAAILKMPYQQELIISVDTLNEGVHFPSNTPAHAIGYKALAVNLSDIAAMGAKPAWFTLALSLPHIQPTWVAEFNQGLRQLADEHAVALIGGDTTRGPLSMTLQIMGLCPIGKALLRSNAQQGDLICVSGTLGDAAAGLAVVQQRLQLPEKAAHFCVQRLNYPTPRLALGQVLQQYAHACMDVSDGLLADLGHLVKASQVGARVETDSLPFSFALSQVEKDLRLPMALTGGDDYELLFTLSEGNLPLVQALAADLGIPITVIGYIDKKINGIALDYELPDKRRGYDHFS